jgi:hypothetical protein
MFPVAGLGMTDTGGAGAEKEANPVGSVETHRILNPSQKIVVVQGQVGKAIVATIIFG